MTTATASNLADVTVTLHELGVKSGVVALRLAGRKGMTPAIVRQVAEVLKRDPSTKDLPARLVVVLGSGRVGRDGQFRLRRRRRGEPRRVTQ